MNNTSMTEIDMWLWTGKSRGAISRRIHDRICGHSLVQSPWGYPFMEAVHKGYRCMECWMYPLYAYEPKMILFCFIILYFIIPFLILLLWFTNSFLIIYRYICRVIGKKTFVSRKGLHQSNHKNRRYYGFTHRGWLTKHRFWASTTMYHI